MKKIIPLILILMIPLSLFSQAAGEEAAVAVQTDSLSADSTVVEETKVLTAEDKLYKQAAEDIMQIYDNWDSSRNYEILYPRIKDFVDEFFTKFPGFEVATLKKDKDELSDHDKRAIVGYKGMKESVYEEISRFVSLKNFYWGYMDNELADKLKSIAKTLGDDARSKEDRLLKEQENYIAELLTKMRTTESQLDSLENGIGTDAGESEAEASLKVSKKRQELISVRGDWIEEKRATMFDLLNYESRRVSKEVSGYLEPMENERNIGNFDISDDFLLSLKNSDNNYEENFKNIIKYKFYSGLIGKFGFYIQYEFKPTFRTFRLNVLIGTILFIMLFFFIYFMVKRNRDTLYIRRIAGLDAIDDAIGRATEMGKPIVYDSGIGSYTNIDTIASMLILKSVAKKVAEFKAEIYVPTCDPIVMQISEEMVASGFLDAGYPEDHKKDNIFFLAANQFAFAAGVSGMLARKKPATAFHFGYYLAESLLIAEAGFSAGAIQVAGTASVGQLPFFITACDYTLIGEELYAAAAYISRDAQILTNLKLSDYAKLAIGLLFIAGTIMLSINSEWTFLQDIMNTR